jgi:hypothetical protein
MEKGHVAGRLLSLWQEGSRDRKGLWTRYRKPALFEDLLHIFDQTIKK